MRTFYEILRFVAKVLASFFFFIGNVCLLVWLARAASTYLETNDITYQQAIAIMWALAGFCVVIGVIASTMRDKY